MILHHYINQIHQFLSHFLPMLLFSQIDIQKYFQFFLTLNCTVWYISFAFVHRVNLSNSSDFVSPLNARENFLLESVILFLKLSMTYNDFMIKSIASGSDFDPQNPGKQIQMKKADIKLLQLIFRLTFSTLSSYTPTFSYLVTKIRNIKWP